ncbi:MAG: hypothetical protein IPJ69_11570 [Deltaproteobacteria bacterium]|nr:MAG: hypothetical protein IPJ69_11570 [Deltaproteobacteria bacterium]
MSISSIVGSVVDWVGSRPDPDRDAANHPSARYVGYVACPHVALAQGVESAASALTGSLGERVGDAIYSWMNREDHSRDTPTRFVPVNDPIAALRSLTNGGNSTAASIASTQTNVRHLEAKS